MKRDAEDYQQELKLARKKIPTATIGSITEIIGPIQPISHKVFANKEQQTSPIVKEFPIDTLPTKQFHDKEQQTSPIVEQEAKESDDRGSTDQSKEVQVVLTNSTTEDDESLQLSMSRQDSSLTVDSSNADVNSPNLFVMEPATPNDETDANTIDQAKNKNTKKKKKKKKKKGKSDPEENESTDVMINSEGQNQSTADPVKENENPNASPETTSAAATTQHQQTETTKINLETKSTQAAADVSLIDDASSSSRRLSIMVSSMTQTEPITFDMLSSILPASNTPPTGRSTPSIDPDADHHHKLITTSANAPTTVSGFTSNSTSVSTTSLPADSLITAMASHKHLHNAEAAKVEKEAESSPIVLTSPNLVKNDRPVQVVDAHSGEFIGTEIPLSKDSATREELIQKHYEIKLNQIMLKLQEADAKAVHYYYNCLKLESLLTTLSTKKNLPKRDWAEEKRQLEKNFEKEKKDFLTLLGQEQAKNVSLAEQLDEMKERYDEMENAYQVQIKMFAERLTE